MSVDSEIAETETVPRRSWDERIAEVHRLHPSTGEKDWAPALRNYDLLGQLLQDAARVGHTPKKRGQRPPMDAAAGQERIRHLWGDDFSTRPFPRAFRQLAGGLSSAEIAERIGLGTGTVQRLLNGSTTPTGAHMEQVAAAFGKRPTWFLEYRQGVILARVLELLQREPDAWVGLAERFFAEG